MECWALPYPGSVQQLQHLIPAGGVQRGCYPGQVAQKLGGQSLGYFWDGKSSPLGCKGNTTQGHGEHTCLPSLPPLLSLSLDRRGPEALPALQVTPCFTFTSFST